MRPPIIVDHKTCYPITRLLLLLKKLNVIDLGYPLEQLQDYIDWFEQTPNAEFLHL